jgi:predicted nucleic acid-binding protein
VFFDTAYIIKFYRNEIGSPEIRMLVRAEGVVYASFWAFNEFHAVLHRHVRESILKRNAARVLSKEFQDHIDEGMWKLLPVNETLLKHTSASLLSAPTGLFLRAGDALHLQTAKDAGEKEIWTNDRHMLAAAPHFGLRGRSATLGIIP